MHRLISVLVLTTCLLILTACRPELPTPMIEVQEQTIQGNTVTIKAAIDEPGWLVIHPVTVTGQADTSTRLAASYFKSAGEYDEITMTLSGTIVGESTMFAMLHYDDPADKQYTAAAGNNDDPPVMVEGDVVAESFKMQGVNPSVDVQKIEGTTITFKVVIDKAGWLVLRPATPELKPDTSTVLKYAYFKESGEYSDVSLELPETVTEGDTIFAILHHDDPANKQFTFSSSGTYDPPIKVDGETVMVDFKIDG